MLRIAVTCSDKASDVENQFENFMLLIGELQEACTVAKGSYEKKLSPTQAEKEIKERRMKEKELKTKRPQEEYDQMKELLTQADEAYAIQQQRPVLEKEERALNKELEGINCFIVNLLEKAKWFTEEEDADQDICEDDSRTIAKKLRQLKTELKDKFECGLKNYRGNQAERVKAMKESSMKILSIIETSQKQLNESEYAKNRNRELVKELAVELECALHAINVYFSNMCSTLPIPNPLPRLDKFASRCSDAFQSHDQTIRMKLETALTGLQAAKDEFKEKSKKNARGQRANL